MGFVTRNEERIKKLLSSKRDISVFQFREPGNNINKIKKWNSKILIDNSKELFNLVFKERSICGNSMILMGN